MSLLSRSALRRTIVFIIPALVALFSAFTWPPERTPALLETFLAPFRQLEWSGYDTFFYWRGQEPVDDRIAVVGFENDAKHLLNVEWPPPRRFHAQVVDNLFKDGAKAILFDVLMGGPSPLGVADDRAFDAALSRAKNVILACRIDRSSIENKKSLVSPYHDDALGIDFEREGVSTSAFVDVPTDNEAIMRRMLPVQKFQGEWLPSLAAAGYLALTGKKIEDSGLTADSISVGGLKVPRTGPTALDPADPDNQMATAYVNFPGGSNIYPPYHYDAVYNGNFAPGTFKDKVVFIGIVGLELAHAQGDYFRTAYSHFSPERVGGQTTRDVYGVVVQAQMLNALLHNGFLRQAMPYETGLLVFIFCGLGTWGIRSFMNWRGPLVMFLSLFGYIALSFGLFLTQHVYVPYVLPGSLMLLSMAGVAYFERGELRRKWAAYVSPKYLEVMLRQGIETKPERFEATVIFGDIRGFTTFSEKHTPEAVVHFLDKHLEKLIDIVYREDGTVDKFLGDGIMVVFGAPLPQEDAALRAVRASWAMREAALIPITDESGQSYVFRTGFGITTGALVAGHVGSKQLASYTLIGDTVNLASRLQALTGEPDVIIDGATYEQVKDHVIVEPLGERKIRGKDEFVTCYVVKEMRA